MLPSKDQECPSSATYAWKSFFRSTTKTLMEVDKLRPSFRDGKPLLLDILNTQRGRREGGGGVVVVSSTLVSYMYQ